MNASLENMADRSRRSWALGLGVLLALFAFRVAAQWWQRLSPVSFLPPFEAWQSGSLPYALLLPLQVVLLALMAATQARLSAGRMRPSRKAGGILLSLGAIYFALALFRLGAAFTFGVGHAFLGAKLPAIFHVVLAGWVLLLGMYHHRCAPHGESEAHFPNAWKAAVPWLAYPVTMAAALWLHFFLRHAGAGLFVSTYGPIAFGALVITWLERRVPHRPEWQPDGEDLQGDGTFMVVVQILLPKALAFFLAATALRWLHAHDLSLTALWPHALPPVVQATLMILVADFLRYWLHRASHEWSTALWSLHAVHHSPQKLYWVNVARFHPIEKSLQFLFDAAPFIVVGVSEQVLAIYFVFYAVNGFFQHCNIELRLGLLNYVISGPELHRWHHSWEIRESNSNYGNNVILWDLLFGSFFHPKEREVELLGLKNRNYPRDFLSQMRTPFLKGADKHEP